jgi:tetrahydromethanopterin S-methyltransferase subunit G
MRNRRAKSPDALARLFLDVTGEMPDDASLLRMRRMSGALNLRDNDALWSMIAVLEYYARLYEAMPDRIRRAGDGGFDAVRREAGEVTDALMRQHRDALARCKATIQLAESMIREHEARYQAALAELNTASMTSLAERMANQVARVAGNRLVGVAAVAAREQRERLNEVARLFERTMESAARQAQENIDASGQRLTRRLGYLLSVVIGLFAVMVAVAFWVGEHAR